MLTFSLSFLSLSLSLSLFSTWYQSHFLVAFKRISGNISTSARVAIASSTHFSNHIVLSTLVHFSTVLFSSHLLHQTDRNREIYSTLSESSPLELSRSFTCRLKILSRRPRASTSRAVFSFCHISPSCTVNTAMSVLTLIFDFDFLG